MVTTKTRTKLTYEDYRNTPDDIRYEVHDGELIRMPSPNTQHQTIRMDMGMALYIFVKERESGTVWPVLLDVVLTDTDIVQPDIMFISNERSHILTEDNVQGSPDLVVEILSPFTADMDKSFKRELYERHGVKEYWIVDPITRNVTVLLLGENGFETAGIYGEGQSLTSPTLPGFTLNLDEIF